VAEARGEIEAEDGVLIIKRIHVDYALRVDRDADDDKVQRAFEHHMARCPVYRSLGGCIDVTTSLNVVP
jgi:uncharacterized OsmC-like protein